MCGATLSQQAFHFAVTVFPNYIFFAALHLAAQTMPHINGVKHVKKISTDSEVSYRNGVDRKRRFIAWMCSKEIGLYLECTTERSVHVSEERWKSKPYFYIWM